MKRFAAIVLLLAAAACHRHAPAPAPAPTPPVPLGPLALPGGAATPVCITDSTGQFCASIVDAGTCNGVQCYGVKTFGLSGATGAAAPGTPAYNPSWYAATDGATTTYICWDPATGSDSASPGTAASCAACSVGATSISTFGEIVRRYGSNAPILTYGNSVAVCQLTAQPTGQDPIAFFPVVSGGGNARLIGSLITKFASFTGGTVTSKVVGAPGTLLSVGGFNAGTAAGDYVFNSTLGSYAAVDVGGATPVMTQPFAAATFTTVTGGLPTVTEDNVWATGNTFVVYTRPNVNLKAWEPHTSADAASSSCGWVQWVSVADPSGANTSRYSATANGVNVVYSGVHFPALSTSAVTALAILIGDDIGGVARMGSETYFIGGVERGGWQTFPGAGTIVFDGDVTLHGTGTNFGTYLSTSAIYGDGAWTFQGGQMVIGTQFITNRSWGSFSLTANANAVIWNKNGAGTWANQALQTTGALKLGANTTGFTPAVGGTFTTNGVNQVTVSGTFPIAAPVSWDLTTLGTTPCAAGGPYFSAASTTGNFFVKAVTASCNDVYTWQAQPVSVSLTTANLDTYGTLANTNGDGRFTIGQ